MTNPKIRRTGPLRQTAPDTAAPSSMPAAGVDWRLLLWLLGTLIFLYAFYSVVPLQFQDFGGQGITRLLLQFLMVTQPDSFLDMWLGGDPARFGILDRLPLLGVAVLILGSATISGWLALRGLKADRGLTRLEVFVCSAGIGLNLWSLVTLAIGLAGGLTHRWLFLALLAANALLGSWMFTRSRRGECDRGTEPEPNRQQSPWVLRAGCLFAAPFVLLILLGGTLPPWHFDVREYHLQAPKEWYQQGSIGFMPYNIYANMPLGAEMHALLGMVLTTGPLDWWYGALAGKVVIAMFVPLTALAVFAAGRRLVSTTGGVVAAVVVISLPWLTHVSFTGLIEGASAFYLFTAFYAVLLAQSRGEETSETAGLPAAPSDLAEMNSPTNSPATNRLPLLAVGGFLAGSAIACKYPGLLFVGIPLGVWVLLGRRHGRVHGAAVYTLALVAACGLWFGKNWVLTGNPTYPLLYTVFGGETMTPEKHAQWAAAHAVPRDLGYSEDSLLARHSPRQFLQGFQRLVYQDDLASPLLAPLAVAGLIAGWRRRWVQVAMALAAFYFVAWWLVTHRLDRFLVPMLPLLALFCAAAVQWLPGRAWRLTIAAFCSLGLLYNLPINASRVIGDNRILVALDDLRTDLPRATEPEGSRVHPAHQWLNQHVPAGQHVLLVGNAQPFDLEVGAYYSTCFDQCSLEAWMRGRTADERRQILREKKVSHVFVHWVEIARYRAPGNYGFTDYVTPDLVRGELVQQGLLRPQAIPGLNPDAGQVFEVVAAP